MARRSLPSLFLLALLCAPAAWGQGDGPGQTGVLQGRNGASVGADDVVASTGFAPTGDVFTIKQEEPDIGSNIRRRVVTSSMPFDKKWNELTPQQQALQRALYEKIPADQEPPFPADGLYTVYKPVSDLIELYARGGRSITTGPLDLGVIVDPDGQVDSIAVHETPDQGLALSLAQALMNVRFKPGRCGGKPCQMEFPVTLNISRRDRSM